MAKDFSGQQDNEEVAFIFRQHQSAMTGGLAKAVLVAIAGFVPLALTQLGYLQPTGTWPWFVTLASVMIAGLMAFHTWLTWYYSIYLVTNLRIRQQLQRGLFRKSVVDIDLAKVQNIRYNISGLRGSLLGCGAITVQTEAGDLVMHRIADCEEICGRLNQAKQIN